ncbi:LysR substrate-binding domain-containing protein [Phaeobacter gallaeciensis]|uniref:Transcriptional regulator n=1 Tax=Phaeobacter gallaeciensis TaxID=60890 RepID=A0AAC9Z9S3_9RHOB|nr:LysR substrate-binding domain-containing protein [Phaeobacter gallaeciensis]AHD10059.1 Transcriptional regulator [Phaeobacter gallaeciensis DSM 26640]ATE93323.1 Transcriptional regulator [Phaeobacter gallaeciensis]ATE96856.1 Transcriptional regulator [Phaeobacter gallaeciensis]ATF01987.1 Transcriptional regulator [Phaeobacter gallaeciensis]ATF06367.1 Transcriptional regulator [Phaeobacter gallaeciensis]
MRFRSYDTLKTFDAVARNLSMTKAADELHQSKGSISYQVGKLEAELGFRLFERAHAKLELTEEGRRLWHVSQTALSQIDREIEDLRGTASDAVTIGALTYFSSRWLSPRLTRFFEANPGISLRIEPINSVEMLRSVKVDMAILWGIGGWRGHESELLLPLPAVPTANRAVAEQARRLGLPDAVRTLPLLGDSSGDAGWRAWHKTAGLPYAPCRSNLTIPDSNSRVQAVVDGQVLALWDDLVAPEINDGTLVRLSDIKVENAGYYVVFTDRPMSQGAEAFLDWLRAEKNHNERPG